MLRQNAAASSWTRSKPASWSAPLPSASKPPPAQDPAPVRSDRGQKSFQPRFEPRFRRDERPENERDQFLAKDRFSRQPPWRTEDVEQRADRTEGRGFRIRTAPDGAGRDSAPPRRQERGGYSGRKSSGRPEQSREWRPGGWRPSFLSQPQTQSTAPAEKPAPTSTAVPRSVPEPSFESPAEPAVAEYRPLHRSPEAPSLTKQRRFELQDNTLKVQGGQEEEIVEVAEPQWKNKFRSSRFANELDLPAEETTSRDAPALRRGRAQSQDFDFAMLEAEQALNGERRKRKRKEKRVEEAFSKPTLQIPEFMSVQQLAQAMKVKVEDLVQKLEEEGFEGARYDHMLDAETSTMFADIYGFEPVIAEAEMQDLVARPPPEDVSVLPPRPPIVTIMGHVDHGKTTILDWLRKSSVAAGEHGGITQHIGAFSVTMPGSERQITFLDTPGHEAFLDMRRRGATVTDIVVLVVAADDSVKPQTIEAIKHALEAQVQIIVAINKVDKHDANIEQVKQDLIRHDIVVEDYGGDFQAIPVSGKTGQGMAELEEAIITLADVLDLRAEQDGPAEGQIIESKVTNAGRVATVLVRRGVLRVGDFIVAGPTWGRVRTLRNDAGALVKEAYPGDPVQVDGWRGEDPTAGLEVLQADDEQHAKDVVELRLERAEVARAASDIASINVTRSQEAEARAKVVEWERENKINRRRHENEGWVDTAASAGPKQVHFVVKADVAGSVEAIVAAVSAIGNHEIRANVIHSGTGPLTESDIHLLATSGEVAYAINFNQPVDPAISSLAHAAKLEVMNHNIIYKVTDAVKQKVQDALPPVITQRVLGEAEVGKLFEIKVKKDTIKIAGCKVTNGTISRANKVRILRHGKAIYTGTLDSLKNVKKDVTEMRKGTECGMGFKDFEDVQEGDQVQCFEEKEEKRNLY